MQAAPELAEMALDAVAGGKIDSINGGNGTFCQVTDEEAETTLALNKDPAW